VKVVKARKLRIQNSTSQDSNSFRTLLNNLLPQNPNLGWDCFSGFACAIVVFYPYLKSYGRKNLGLNNQTVFITNSKEGKQLSSRK